MKYPSTLTAVIRDVVLHATAEPREFVTPWTTEHIPEDDRQRFDNLVHTELKGLHEGNIARYRLRPAKFKAWQEISIESHRPSARKVHQISGH